MTKRKATKAPTTPANPAKDGGITFAHFGYGKAVPNKMTVKYLGNGVVRSGSIGNVSKGRHKGSVSAEPNSRPVTSAEMVKVSDYDRQMGLIRQIVDEDREILEALAK